MNIIGNKYKEFKVALIPDPKDYKSEIDFHIAIAEYKVRDLVEPKHLKYSTYKIPNTELKKGNYVFIDRWDGNGIMSKVKILRVEKGLSRAIIRCDKGYFVYSKWNCNTDNIQFTWTCENKEWEKKNKKWIDGNNYFIKL